MKLSCGEDRRTGTVRQWARAGIGSLSWCSQEGGAKGCVCVIFTGLFLADYVLALEAEIRTLKHKFKTLEEHLEDVLDPLKMSSPRAESQPSVRSSTETTGESPRLTGLLAVPL